MADCLRVEEGLGELRELGRGRRRALRPVRGEGCPERAELRELPKQTYKATPKLQICPNRVLHRKRSSPSCPKACKRTPNLPNLPTLRAPPYTELQI